MLTPTCPRFRYLLLTLTLAVMSPGATAEAQAQGSICPPRQTLVSGLSLPMSAVRFLADDALGGRLAGSSDERCAGDFIAAEFARLGLVPAGDDDTFFQSLSLQSAINPHAPGGTGRNVVARLEGADPTLSREVVVIGAHYDHLGDGTGAGSLAPGTRATHNGADDNASGVAAMLAAADQLAHGTRPARTIVFAAFTGEESGLLGSAHFTREWSEADGRMVGMINLDMVGRLGAGPLIVYGVDTAEEWMALLEPAAAAAGITLATRGEGYGPSDHTSFYLRDVPVLHFFTNTHGDYHKPTDDWQAIDAAGLGRVADLVVTMAGAVAGRPAALTLRRGAGEPPRQNAEVGSGYGAYLGSVPDFTPVERGVKLSGVTAGAPADAAGIRAGDIVIGIGAHEVADLQAMTDALRALKPGDQVDVRVLRGTETLTLRVTLGSRSSL